MTSTALARKAKREEILTGAAKSIRDLLDEMREEFVAVGGSADAFEDEVLELVTGEDEEEGE